MQNGHLVVLIKNKTMQIQINITNSQALVYIVVFLNKKESKCSRFKHIHLGAKT